MVISARPGIDTGLTVRSTVELIGAEVVFNLVEPSVEMRYLPPGLPSEVYKERMALISLDGPISVGS